MSGGKLYPLFAEVRRHAEEGRANVLVSLELLRRQVEVLENAERDRERVEEIRRPKLSDGDVATLKRLLAEEKAAKSRGKMHVRRKSPRKKPAAHKR